MKKGFILLTVLALAAMVFAGCDSFAPLTSEKANLGNAGELSTGTVEVRVTDGPPGYEVQEVEMQVGSVEIHMAEEEEYQNEGQGNQHQEQDGDGNWIPLDILEDINPFILTDLQNGKEQTLALGHVDPGKYTQIRMGIDWVEISYTKDGEPQGPVRAILPSDKLKFVRPFNVEEEETTVITFDFIVDESVVFTGAKASEAPKVMFKPVIKLQIEPGQPAQEEEGPTATFDPTSAPAEMPIAVSGAGWTGEETINSVTVGVEAAVYSLDVNAGGELEGTITVPALEPGVKDIVITGSESGAQTFTGAFEVTSLTVIDIAAMPGVTLPATGGTPVAVIIETAQYTGTISWNPADNPFQSGTVYTATITLMAKAGYTLTGVVANFFTVAGATSVSNAADSGVVTAVFPATA
jgi:hypothetical protein